jgi:hypothetical protein
MTKRLLVSTSAHGFGHAAQTSVVVDAVRARWPDLEVTLRTALPRQALDSFFAPPFELIETADDVGMLMASPLEVRVDDTAAAYRAFHADWDRRVDEDAARLARLAPDLVLANASYLALAAAARAGIPAVGLCSLNWADLYWDFCRGRPGARRIHEQIRGAYRQAEVFLLPEPSLAMAWLPRRRAIGTLARLGAARRPALCAALGVPAERKLVLVAFGGIAAHGVPLVLPRDREVAWLVDRPGEAGRDDVLSIRGLGWPFPDILRSVDAVVTKPGYGTVAEAACNGTRVLFVRRGDWAEETPLVAWLERHGVCAEIATADLAGGRFMPALSALLARPAIAGPPATGGREAADALAPFLEGGRAPAAVEGEARP